MTDGNTIEKCVAMVLVAVLATVGSKFGMTETMFGLAATDIFALAGTGPLQALRKRADKEDAQ